MFRTIKDILNVYKVNEYYLSTDTYPPYRTSIGVIDKFDNMAVWYTYYTGSFYYFTGRTDIRYLEDWGFKCYIE